MSGDEYLYGENTFPMVNYSLGRKKQFCIMDFHTKICFEY